MLRLVLLLAILFAAPAWAQPQMVSTSSAPGYQTVQDEASNLTRRRVINFTGAGVSCVDNSGSARTDCTISGGGGSSFTRYATTAALPSAASSTGVLAIVDADNSWYYSDGASWARQGLYVSNAQTATTSTTINALVVRVDASGGGLTVTLPVIPALGQVILISRTDSTAANTVTLAAGAGNTLDGFPSTTVTPLTYAFLTAGPGETAWQILVLGSSRPPTTSVTVDFGAAGNTNVAKVVTGVPWVQSTSVILCAPTTEATLDRLAGAEDPAVEGLTAAVGNVVAGTGFTLYVAAAVRKAYGKFIFSCIGANP